MVRGDGAKQKGSHAGARRSLYDDHGAIRRDSRAGGRDKDKWQAYKRSSGPTTRRSLARALIGAQPRLLFLRLGDLRAPGGELASHRRGAAAGPLTSSRKLCSSDWRAPRRSLPPSSAPSQVARRSQGGNPGLYPAAPPAWRGAHAGTQIRAHRKQHCRIA